MTSSDMVAAICTLIFETENNEADAQVVVSKSKSFCLEVGPPRLPPKYYVGNSCPT
jgi:hypothetical protein